MAKQWFGCAVGALLGLGLAATAQASPASMGRTGISSGDTAQIVTKAHSRRWCDREDRHVHRYRYYAPSYSYRAYRPRYYGYVDYAPRYYSGPHYYRTYGYGPYDGYYGYGPSYRSSSFSFWW